ncbi:hypothetical protein K501DRAFT_136618, partial [Backusella circina FSU 941]
ILDLTLRRPQPVSQPKKRKRKNDSSEESVGVNARIGSRAEHYIEFISELMDTLDANNIKRYYFIIENATIHTNVNIRKIIEDCGHKCVYLPLYSPFLNPIEEF